MTATSPFCEDRGLALSEAPDDVGTIEAFRRPRLSVLVVAGTFGTTLPALMTGRTALLDSG